MLQKIKISAGDNLELSSGAYLIEEEVGEGGFGTVFKAIKDKQYYAIKLSRIWELLPGDREEIKERIRQEFAISHGIQSSHIVHAYSMDEIHENPIIVMDYCQDGSLRNRIGDSYTEDVISNIGIQILYGINTLHSFGIIHRDIKPENILFNNEQVMLTDFGISANLKHRLTETDIRGHSLKVFATISYSPPEQSQKSLAFKSTAPTIDIFSFGAIIYELITKGTLPFGNIKEFQVDSKIIEEKKITGKWDEIKFRKSTNSSLWYNIIKKCLDPNPEKRFQTTDEIIKLLTIKTENLVVTSQNWIIQIIEGSEPGREYSLTNLSKNLGKKILTIGRYSEEDPFVNDIAIREESTNYISTHHGTYECIVSDSTVKWYLRDGQWYQKDNVKGWHLSKNGIEVNSVKIDEKGILLNNNDIIKIGKTILKVLCQIC